MRLRTTSEVQPAHIDLTPMIDTVMFLLIFFMVTTTLGQKESDLGITLPGTLVQGTALDMPDEQVIEVDSQGHVSLNGRQFAGKAMPDLVQILRRYKLASDADKTKSLITIQADDQSDYARVVDVMNACAGAGITNMTFGSG